MKSDKKSYSEYISKFREEFFITEIGHLHRTIAELRMEIDNLRALKKIIHINQHKIKANINAEELEPVITCKTYKSNDYAFEAEILGPCKVIYSPDKPLSCGARVWIETKSDVKLKKS